MRSLETTVMCYFWDYDLELTIGLQGLGLVPGVRWGWEQGLCRAPLPPHTPGTNDPDCLSLILWPIALLPFLCPLGTFILGEVAAIATCGWWPRMRWVLSMDFFSYGRFFVVFRSRHPVHKRACLFSSSPCGGEVRA
jgi:hypothetical protein